MNNYNERLNLYNNINNCNMNSLSRKYKYCNNSCIFPLNCTFDIPFSFYKITGNFVKSSNNIYNTIWTFTENVTIHLFIKTRIYGSVASQSNPSVIVQTFENIANPGVYNVDAGTLGLYIKAYINFPRC